MEPTESMPIIITPPPPPSPVPTPREWPAAIEVTPPPTDMVSPSPGYVGGDVMVALVLGALVVNLALARRLGR